MSEAIGMSTMQLNNCTGCKDGKDCTENEEQDTGAVGSEVSWPQSCSLDPAQSQRQANLSTRKDR